MPMESLNVNREREREGRVHANRKREREIRVHY